MLSRCISKYTVNSTLKPMNIAPILFLNCNPSTHSWKWKKNQQFDSILWATSSTYTSLHPDIDKRNIIIKQNIPPENHHLFFSVEYFQLADKMHDWLWISNCDECDISRTNPSYPFANNAIIVCIFCSTRSKQITKKSIGKKRTNPFRMHIYETQQRKKISLVNKWNRLVRVGCWFDKQWAYWYLASPPLPDMYR